MPGIKEAKGFFYSVLVIGTLVIIASLYSTVWASPSQGVSAGGTVPTLPTLPSLLANCVVTPPSATVIIGQTQQFTYAGTDIDGNPVTTTVTWSVVAGGGTINSTGLFTAGSSTGTFTGTVKGSGVLDQTCDDFASVTVVVNAAATAAANAAAEAAAAEAAAAQATAVAAAANAEATAAAAAAAAAAAIPVVAGFDLVDTTSTEGDISVPIDDTDQGTLVTDDSGNVTLVTAQQQVSIPDTGTVKVHLEVGMSEIPGGGSLDVSVTSFVSEDFTNAFKVAATNAGGKITNTAFYVTVDTVDIEEGVLTQASVNVVLSEQWVNDNGGPGSIRILRLPRNLGGIAGAFLPPMVEVLETMVVGRDAEGNYLVTGVSPRGFSTFAVVALEDAPPVLPPPGGAITAFAPGATSTLSAPDGKVTITIPSTAPAGSFFLVYEPEAEADAPAAPLTGLAFGTALFDLSVVDLAGDPASGATFISPITITVAYSDTDLQAADGNPDRLVLYKYDSVFEEWTPLATTFSTAAKTVQAQVTQLSFFALMGQAQPPTPTPTPTATLRPGAPTPTLLLPTPGDAAPGSGLLIGLLIAAFILIAAGSYYLRQSKQS